MAPDKASSFSYSKHITKSFKRLDVTESKQGTKPLTNSVSKLGMSCTENSPMDTEWLWSLVILIYCKETEWIKAQCITILNGSWFDQFQNPDHQSSEDDLAFGVRTLRFSFFVLWWLHGRTTLYTIKLVFVQCNLLAVRIKFKNAHLMQAIPTN